MEIFVKLLDNVLADNYKYFLKYIFMHLFILCLFFLHKTTDK